jgi:hypothetical protein
MHCNKMLSIRPSVGSQNGCTLTEELPAGRAEPLFQRQRKCRRQVTQLNTDFFDRPIGMRNDLRAPQGLVMSIVIRED